MYPGAMKRTHHPASRGIPLLPLAILSILTMLAACAARSEAPPSPSTAASAGSDQAASAGETSPLQAQLAAATPARALPPSDAQQRLGVALDQHFQRSLSRRLYVHLDKPMYQPGETIWFRVWELFGPTLVRDVLTQAVNVELVSPRGAVVERKRIQARAGLATNDFVLPPTAEGGEYTVRVSTQYGERVERPALVSTYQPPRIKKKLELLRKAYGPGDEVAAALALHRATGEPLGRKQVTAVVTVDEAEVARFAAQTDDAGNRLVRFELPERIARGDGLLTILVEDGGVTESIQKRIPIVLGDLRLALYPEGGDLVAGLPGRVYFAARNLLDEPADVEGRLVDDAGVELARLRSLHRGMGRFAFTPHAGKRYFVEITRPAGIARRIPVPAAVASGCVMQAVDDFESARDDVRVGVFCTEDRTVVATAALRQRRLGDVSAQVTPGAPTVIALPVPAGSQGAVRVTLFDDALRPLAERLVYRGRGADLKVSIRSDRDSYAPRDPVTLTIETHDLAGKPVEADLSLAVADDTVLAFADDKTAHLLARMYLESEMPGQEIEEPNFYFSDDSKAPRALDMVLGTQGWRRFAWEAVLAPAETSIAAGEAADDAMVAMPEEVAEAEPEMERQEKVPMRPMPARPQAVPPPPPPVAPAQEQAAPARREAPADRARGRAAPGQRRARGGVRADRKAIDRGADVFGDLGPRWDEDRRRPRQAWAPVREFPVPNYEGRYDGPRTDFRETIYWQPSVKTDAGGRATVRFYLSDAITSFRATAEGVSLGGLPGRGETLVQSKLPVSLAVTMPLEVSAGDAVHLPVTLANETSRPYEVAVSAQFGRAFRVEGGVPRAVSLAAGERRSFFATLQVVGDGKRAFDGDIAIGIETANLKDEVSRTIRVVPLGFPREISLAGTLPGADAGKAKRHQVRHEVDLAGALPGTLAATVQLYPSPLATMIEGAEAIIREPTGCFEQASSANYPNIMVLGYLEEHDAVDPAVVERTLGMLDRGYQKLTGYESSGRGFEWFGGDPGHEALTAYGLMEFVDMGRVYGSVDQAMVERTRAWLRARRDGKGGYQRNARALDSFGRASEEVTNGYITYALSEAGETDLAKDLAYQKRMAATTSDPYLMALAANVLVNLEPEAKATRQALRKLEGMQGDDGAFAGADHSITRSGGQALMIETTSLAALALIDAGQAGTPVVRKAMEWLNAHRNGHGGYGSTQSTILALDAMTTYASASRVTRSSGVATVRVNGREVGRVAFEKGHADTIVFDDLAAALVPGKNVIELGLQGENPLPYSLALSYRSRQPASSPESAVRVATSLGKATVPMGESVRMKVKVENVTDRGIPMTLARVGLPGGLTFQSWQLEELKDRGVVDFYETGAREVVLYFRSMGPKAVASVDLDLIARVPGSYVAAASRAYLYYTDELEHWVEPVRIAVTP